MDSAKRHIGTFIVALSFLAVGGCGPGPGTSDALGQFEPRGLFGTCQVQMEPHWLLVCRYRPDSNDIAWVEVAGQSKPVRFGDLSDDELIERSLRRYRYWKNTRPSTIGYRTQGALLNFEVGNFSKLVVLEILKEFQPPNKVMDDCGFLILAARPEALAAYTNVQSTDWAELRFHRVPRRLQLDRARADALLEELGRTSRKLPGVLLALPTTGLPFTMLHYLECDGERLTRCWSFATFGKPYDFLAGRWHVCGTDEDVLRILRNPKWREGANEGRSVGGLPETELRYQPFWRDVIVSDANDDSLALVAGRYHEIVRRLWDVMIGLPTQRGEETIGEETIFEDDKDDKGGISGPDDEAAREK